MTRTRRRPPPPAAPAPPRHSLGWAAALAIFGLALVVRCLHVWEIHDAPFFTTLMGDSKAYDVWARRVAAGDWLGDEVFYQAPLYPYFLGVLYAVLGRNLLAVRIVQALLGSGACVLVALAGCRFFGDGESKVPPDDRRRGINARRVGIVAGASLALYAPLVFADALIQKSVLDVFLMCLTVWLASRAMAEPARRLRWFGLGAAIALLSLTRENSLVLAVAVLAWLWIARGTSGRAALGHAAAFVVGLAVLLAPVAIRNKIVGGELQLTTSQSGPNLFIGNNAGADGTYMALRAGRGDPEYERQDATDLAERAAGRRLTPGEVSRYWRGRAFEYIRSHPVEWLRLLGRKVALLWNRTEMFDTESQATHAERSAVLRRLEPVAHFGVLAPLALFGAWVSWRQRARVSLLSVMLVAYAASVVIFYVFARYRYPLVPLLVLFAAAGLAAASSFFREEPPSHVAGCLAAVGAFAVLCNWPLLSSDLMRAITETNLATALREAGRPDQSAAHYRRAIEIRPDYAPARSNFGALLRAEGRTDEAIAQYREALRLQPESTSARYNLANALLARGQAREAAEEFRRVLAATPQSVDARNNLGIALAQDGRLEDAAAAFRQALDVDPRSAEAHYNLANALVDLGTIDEAIRQYRQALAAKPDYADAHANFGRLLLQQGELREASAELRRAAELDPASAETRNNLGIALASQGRVDEAIEQFRRALEINPELADARRNLALATTGKRKK